MSVALAIFFIYGSKKIYGSSNNMILSISIDLSLRERKREILFLIKYSYIMFNNYGLANYIYSIIYSQIVFFRQIYTVIYIGLEQKFVAFF